MTDQRKIDPRGAKPASLFERADAVFGLGPRRGAADLIPPVPDLPQVPPALRRPQPSARPASGPAAPSSEAAAPAAAAPAAAPEPAAPRAVAFCGPRAMIDREDLREAGLIVPEDPVNGLLEEFRIVKRELLADARSGGALARRILVCSPHQGEGKTYCATNLAIALAAERGVEVLLADADVVRPSITEQFGIEADLGLMDALADPSLLPENLVIRTDIPGLFVLPAGTPSARDAEYLASARTAEVLDRLTQGAPDRFVIFDTPPALAASPAAELAQHVGQALLVVRADETSRAALEDAQQLLSACADIKLLLNAARYSPSGRRFGSYGGRGE